MLVEGLLVQHKATIADSDRLGVAETLERHKIVRTLAAKDISAPSAMVAPSDEVKNLSTQRARADELVWDPRGRQ